MPAHNNSFLSTASLQACPSSPSEHTPRPTRKSSKRTHSREFTSAGASGHSASDHTSFPVQTQCPFQLPLGTSRTFSCPLPKLLDFTDNFSHSNTHLRALVSLHTIATQMQPFSHICLCAQASSRRRDCRLAFSSTVAAAAASPSSTTRKRVVSSAVPRRMPI